METSSSPSAHCANPSAPKGKRGPHSTRIVRLPHRMPNIWLWRKRGTGLARSNVAGGVHRRRERQSHQR
jgi:hypothetical protein